MCDIASSNPGYVGGLIDRNKAASYGILVLSRVDTHVTGKIRARGVSGDAGGEDTLEE